YSMIKVRELERRRWETEDMLVRMATMADHIKSQMQLANAANLGLVVHDLKNRIAPLSMVNEMLNEVFGNWKKDGSLNDLVFHDALELSDRAVTTLLTQTGDILRDVARVQVGGQSFSLFKLQQILGNLESGMVHEDRIEAMRKLTSVVEVSSFPEGEVPGNIDDLQLIFINIIQNAVAAGAKSVRIDSAFDSDGKNIEMTIANNGKPLTAAQKETLFHPFCSGKKGGTGVGLFFAKQWLESIGGDIVLRDSHEQKTVFAIIMPLKDDKTSKDNNAKQKTSGLYSSIKGTGKHTVPKGTGKHVSSKGTGKNASPGSTGERDSAKITAKQKKVSGEPF
ncbi:HAMP domain-containing histidine kinase, partial [Myxococcota bacterium]|nr:HAMP domain-containing histidine kinase [Myxococcota bacterium]